MTTVAYGFIGLGNMGGPMCGHLAAAGLDLTVFDAAGTARLAPEGAKAAPDVAGLARAADTVFLSLPDGKVVAKVAAEIAAAEGRRTRVVVDLSTTGPAAAAAIAETVAGAGMVFVDAPVSGGRAGAIAGTITIMCACSEDAFAALAEPFGLIGGNVFHVGTEPGQGQATKLLNNFLSATAMAATSEAMLFGAAYGLDMKTVLDAVNVSTGRNTATSDKFPNRILTGRYDAGFSTALMAKDVALFLEHVRRAGTPGTIAADVAEIWRGVDEALPGSDFTEIFKHLSGKVSG